MTDCDSLGILLKNRLLIARKTREFTKLVIFSVLVGYLAALTVWKVKYKVNCVMNEPATIYNDTAIVKSYNIGVPHNYNSERVMKNFYDTE